MKLRNWTLAVMFALTAGGATLSVTLPTTAGAACVDHFLTFPTWYRGVTDGSCNVVIDDLKSDIWKIVLNVIEIMLQLVGYLSTAYILVGGFRYLTSAGQVDANAKARKTILNAIIGLVISIFSVGIVNVVVGTIK